MTLQPTNRLRFVERDVLVHIPLEGMNLRSVKILQQAWQNLDDGSIEWRDIPLEVESAT